MPYLLGRLLKLSDGVNTKSNQLFCLLGFLLSWTEPPPCSSQIGARCEMLFWNGLVKRESKVIYIAYYYTQRSLNVLDGDKISPVNLKIGLKEEMWDLRWSFILFILLSASNTPDPAYGELGNQVCWSTLSWNYTGPRTGNENQCFKEYFKNAYILGPEGFYYS